MRKINVALLVILAFVVFVLTCCTGNTSSKKSIMTPGSTGAPYEVLVVYSQGDMESGAYQALYNVLHEDIAGLPQPENAFNVSNVMEPQFTRTFKFCRNIIVIKVDRIYSEGKIKFSRDVYSSPQVIMTIQAGDGKQFKEFVSKNADVIRDFFTKVEMSREIAELKLVHSKMVSEKVKELFDCDIWVPIDISRQKIGKDFYWATSNNADKDISIVVYSYPYRDLNTFTPEYFFNKRDSFMKANIPGPREGQYMSTARDYVTFTNSEINGSYAQIARGLWEMENYDMGGPFVSVSRLDEKNQRVIVTEGFVYAPGTAKKNMMRRMEAAVYTLQLPEDRDTERFSYVIEEVVVTPQKTEN